MATRFIQKIDTADGDLSRCWLWLGGKNPKGYGIFAAKSHKQERAHRVSYRLYHGKEPRQMVLHSCDNPACVNPTHLTDGPHGENMRQMAERKRAAREERHHKAKLSYLEVLAIVLLHRGGDYPTRELASMFGMSQPTVASIVSGHLWPGVVAQADAMLAARKQP